MQLIENYRKQTIYEERGEKMTEIIINGEHTKIITSDVEIYIKGYCEIKKTPVENATDASNLPRHKCESFPPSGGNLRTLQ